MIENLWDSLDDYIKDYPDEKDTEEFQAVSNRALQYTYDLTDLAEDANKRKMSESEFSTRLDRLAFQFEVDCQRIWKK